MHFDTKSVCNHAFYVYYKLNPQETNKEMLHTQYIYIYTHTRRVAEKFIGWRRYSHGNEVYFWVPHTSLIDVEVLGSHTYPPYIYKYIYIYNALFLKTFDDHKKRWLIFKKSNQKICSYLANVSAPNRLWIKVNFST